MSLHPDERKEAIMLARFLLSVVAGVATNFISKWLDRIKDR